jgi:2-oxoglutarate ferredoxin oxidoreductase subunit alpha
MKVFESGSKLLVKAALEAGVGFFSGYPITPASKILEYFAQEAVDNSNLVCFQAEDEISAIHSVIGASIGGKKAMTATSGPGFSLMQEGLGLAFATSVPLVVVNVMRQGPSTGMSTKPAQGDILQTQFGTHGDYKAIVFYPNSVEEIYTYTIQASNAAEEGSSPVILLLDAVLANLYETIDLKKGKRKFKNHTLKFGESNRHLSGLVTDNNGIPQTNNAQNCKSWLQERHTRIEKASKNYQFYEYLRNKTSDTLLVAFGAVSRLLPDSDKWSLFRPIRLFPICPDLKDIVSSYKKIIVVEMNKGQYCFALEAYLKREIEKVSIIGGELDPDELLNKINEKL